MATKETSDFGAWKHCCHWRHIRHQDVWGKELMAEVHQVHCSSEQRLYFSVTKVNMAMEWTIYFVLCCLHWIVVFSNDNEWPLLLLQYPLYKILVYDEFQNGIPVCHFLIEKYKVVNMVVLLMVTRDKAESLRLAMGLSAWHPNCWLIDVASKEISALGYFSTFVFALFIRWPSSKQTCSFFKVYDRAVWPDILVTLCTWHVRRPWTKNLIAKVSNLFAKAQMNHDLGDIMYTNERVNVISVFWFFVLCDL